MSKATVLERVRENLSSARAAQHTFTQEISAIADDTTTTITVLDGTVWEAGDILEVEETGELCYVRSVSTNDLTVIRGYNDTTAAATTDTVPLARKNPRWTEQEIDYMYSQVLDSLWGHGIFQWADAPVTVDTTLNPQVETISSARIRSKDIIAVTYTTKTNGYSRHAPFRVRPYRDGTTFNVDVDIFWPGDVDPLVAAQVLYIAPISDFDSDDVHPDIEHILVDGITYRLMAQTMADRTFDPGLLTDRTVQPGQGGRDARFFQGEFVLGVRRLSQILKVEIADRRLGQDYGTSRARRWRV